MDHRAHVGDGDRCRCRRQFRPDVDLDPRSDVFVRAACRRNVRSFPRDFPVGTPGVDNSRHHSSAISLRTSSDVNNWRHSSFHCAHSWFLSSCFRASPGSSPSHRSGLTKPPTRRFESCSPSCSPSLYARPWPPGSRRRRTAAYAISSFFGELAIGVTFGFVGRLVFRRFEVAAHFLGFQMGFSLAGTIDPATRAQTTALGTIAQMMGLMVLLAREWTSLVPRGDGEKFFHDRARSSFLRPHFSIFFSAYRQTRWSSA